MTEAEFHVQVARYLDAVLLSSAWWTTFPAGSGGKARGGQLRARGLKPGVPDIMLVYGGRVYWIELKSSKGRLSDDQKICIPELLLAGSLVQVARSLEDVRVALDRYGIPYRQHLI